MAFFSPGGLTFLPGGSLFRQVGSVFRQPYRDSLCNASCNIGQESHAVTSLWRPSLYFRPKFEDDHHNFGSLQLRLNSLNQTFYIDEIDNLAFYIPLSRSRLSNPWQQCGEGNHTQLAKSSFNTEV